MEVLNIAGLVPELLVYHAVGLFSLLTVTSDSRFGFIRHPEISPLSSPLLEQVADALMPDCPVVVLQYIEKGRQPTIDPNCIAYFPLTRIKLGVGKPPELEFEVGGNSCVIYDQATTVIQPATTAKGYYVLEFHQTS
jgi:hypothetical protein